MSNIQENLGKSFANIPTHKMTGTQAFYVMVLICLLLASYIFYDTRSEDKRLQAEKDRCEYIVETILDATKN